MGSKSFPLLTQQALAFKCAGTQKTMLKEKQYIYSNMELASRLMASNSFDKFTKEKLINVLLLIFSPKLTIDLESEISRVRIGARHEL